MKKLFLILLFCPLFFTPCSAEALYDQAADMLPGGKLAALINDVGTALAMLLGLVGCCGIMLFISIMSGIKVVTV